MPSLVEVDSLEVLVIVDNEVDPMSTYSNPGVKVSGNLLDIGFRAPLQTLDRGDAVSELRMDEICCGAHGLSLMITARKGDQSHTVLFDTGPEERVWEQNANKLQTNLASVELIHLSHWHRDHSGGMLRAIEMIQAAKSTANSQTSTTPLLIDLHPARPTYRGIMAQLPISLEPDPTFESITAAGGTLSLHTDPHSILDSFFLTSGFIPRVTSYETGLKRGIHFNPTTGSWEKDELIADERFLVCHVKNKGLVLFTGCSHGGAVNACKHAVELAGGNVPLFGVVGGYHLVGPNEVSIKETVRDFQALDPKVLLAGHCTGWKAKFEMEREMPGRLCPSAAGTCFTF